MELRELINNYILYNHYGYFMRRMRLIGQTRGSVDVYQESLIINELCFIFSCSKEEMIEYYCDWYDNNFTK